MKKNVTSEQNMLQRFSFLRYLGNIKIAIVIMNDYKLTPFQAGFVHHLVPPIVAPEECV